MQQRSGLSGDSRAPQEMDPPPPPPRRHLAPEISPGDGSVLRPLLLHEKERKRERDTSLPAT